MNRMIHLRSGQLTLRWILTCSVWLFFILTPGIQANIAPCNDSCRLLIQDEARMYHKFKTLTMSDSVKVIFFQLQIGNSSFNTGKDSPVYFAWIRNNFGKAVFTLPTSFITMSFSLYSIFTANIHLTLIDSNHKCYEPYFNKYNCRKHIIFNTLTHFTRFNHTCHGESCSTICQRKFNPHDGNFGYKVRATCCRNDYSSSQINTTQCLNIPEKPPWYVAWSLLITVFLSVFLAGFTVNKFINWFLRSAQR